MFLCELAKATKLKVIPVTSLGFLENRKREERAANSKKPESNMMKISVEKPHNHLVFYALFTTFLIS